MSHSYDTNHNPNDHEEAKDKGIIAWLVHNRVTANLLMMILLVGGLFISTKITQEVFPEFEDDFVTITALYPGASPEEVEQGIVLAVEEAIRGVNGVKEIIATSAESLATINAEIEPRADRQQVYQDIQQQVDRITTFPLDAEQIQVSLLVRKREVISVQVYGDASEWILREIAEQTRESLLQDPNISQVELSGIRNFEVQVEVSQDAMRSYNLTLEEIARRIRTTAIELPGGSVETSGGKILIRFTERKDWAREFSSLPIINTPDGSTVLLENIAEVKDGFAESDNFASFNNQTAIGLNIFRVGNETPIGVSESARSVLEKMKHSLPPGVHFSINRDQSEIYQQRLDLLMRNACIGLLLVLFILGTFLERKLALWVTIGIPTAFIGAFVFLPLFGVTINMISMFAFIIALGIVVDDAIVVGENIYEYRQKGFNHIDAAIEGAKNVTVPVSFSILTNIVAFAPLLFVPGMMGKIWAVIPIVVSTIFIISWIESLFILPVHLAHSTVKKSNSKKDLLDRYQEYCSRGLQSFVDTIYSPFISYCISFRYISLAIAFALLLSVLGYAVSGRLGFELMPKVESDSAVVTAILPVSTPQQKTREILSLLTEKSFQLADENGGDKLHLGTFGVIIDNTVEVSMYLSPPEIRPLSTSEVTDLWRDKVGVIPGLQSLRFESDRGGPGRGPTLTVELSHRDIEVLNKSSKALSEYLNTFPNLNDIDDGYAIGKSQLDFELLDAGRILGLSTNEVARQVRNAFFGAEALRQQRGRNEFRVMVRLPEAERQSEYFVENLLIRTPSGREVPLSEVAKVTRGRAFTTIIRRDGRRTLSVTANVNPQSEASRITDNLKLEFLPNLVKDYPGLSYSFEGRHADMKESFNSLISGLLLALIAIYFLLAIPFRSYTQPLIVMTAIPFGIIGAIFGHLVMGYSMSIISLMGVVALTGVVVNDSLVIIDYANQRRKDGLSPYDSITSAASRRFRPILLTTLTTFCGLAPMIFETSRQARFLIPMALSLGYGIVFATAIILVVVPCLYMVLEDIKRIKSNFLS